MKTRLLPRAPKQLVKDNPPSNNAFASEGLLEQAPTPAVVPLVMDVQAKEPWGHRGRGPVLSAL